MVVLLAGHVLTMIEDLHDVLEQGTWHHNAKQTRVPYRKEVEAVLRHDEGKLGSW